MAELKSILKLLWNNRDKIQRHRKVRKGVSAIIEAYKRMVADLNDVNKSLSELVVAQQQTILRLQGLQTSPTPNE